MDHRNDKLTLEDRENIAKKFREQYPDKIPIYVERQIGGNCHFSLDRNKFLVSNDLTMGRFVFEVRKHVTSWPGHDFSSKAIFFFCRNNLIPGHIMLGQIYNKYKDDCGFLNFTVSEESTFGMNESNYYNQIDLIDKYKRKKFGYKIREMYTDRVPIVIKKSPNASFDLSKIKFLSPEDISISRFMYELKKYIYYSDDRKAQDVTYFLICNNVILTNTMLMGQVYKRYMDKLSGCLFINLSEESVFG